MLLDWLRKQDSKLLVLVGNSASPEMRRQFADSAAMTNVRASIGKFNSDEPFVELFYKEGDDWEKNQALLQGKKAFVVQSTGRPVGDNFMHLCLMVHTLKAYGVKSVAVIEPFAAELRQDRAFEKKFVSLGALFSAGQLKSAGADEVYTFTPHSRAAIAAYRKVFGRHFHALNTADLFAGHQRKTFGSGSGVMSGAPDGGDRPGDEGQCRVRENARARVGQAMTEKELDKLLYTISKHREGSETEVTGFSGDVKGKPCVMIDDMIDGGSTTRKGAGRLKTEGATEVVCYATHAILSDKLLPPDKGDNPSKRTALETLLLPDADGTPSPIDILVLTDTVPDVHDKLQAFHAAHPGFEKKVEVLSVAEMAVATALKNSQPSILHKVQNWYHGYTRYP